MMEWQWHQLNHMQIICTSLQTGNHASISSLFLMPNLQRQSTEGNKPDKCYKLLLLNVDWRHLGPQHHQPAESSDIATHPAAVFPRRRRRLSPLGSDSFGLARTPKHTHCTYTHIHCFNDHFLGKQKQVLSGRTRLVPIFWSLENTFVQVLQIYSHVEEACNW